MPTNAPKTPEYIRIYESHGILFHKQEGNEHKSDCPFCDGSAFFVNEEKGTFHCKTCPVSGNAYTFLQTFYDHWHSKTTTKQYKALSKDRGIPYEAFEMAELAWDGENKRWLFPVRNSKGSMVNLVKWDPVPNAEGKRLIINTSECKLHLHNLERLGDSPKVYVCEGPHDQIAWEYFLYLNKIKDSAIVAVPGCQTFKEEWAEHFADREVTFLYDNDEPGTLGMDRAITILRKATRCRSISKINWPESFPEKFDIRDYVSKNLSRPERGLLELKQMLSEVEVLTHKSNIKRTSFKELIKDFKDCVYFPQEMQDGLLISLAVILSNRLFIDPYCPIWLYIVGPSGKGKTMILQSCSETEVTRFETTIGPKTLVSGWKDSSGEDMSLLPHIIYKTLIIEDFTAIMNLPAGDQNEVYATLRTTYNGRYEKTFAHIGTRVYPDPSSGHPTCHYTVLAGCTGVIHADKRANEGERFLKFHMPMGDDPARQVRSAINKTVNEETPETLLREPVSAFIEHKLENLPESPPKVPEWIINRTIGLSQITAMLISVVVRKQDELISRPEPGIATRISKQLIKSGQAIAFVLGKKEVDAECYRIMQRLGFNTAYGWACDAFIAVALAGKDGGTSKEVGRAARMKGGTAYRALEDLFELGLVNFKEDSSRKGKGRPDTRWFLTPLAKELWTMAKIDPKSLDYQPAGLHFKQRAKHLGSPNFSDEVENPRTARRRAEANGHKQGPSSPRKNSPGPKTKAVLERVRKRVLAKPSSNGHTPSKSGSKPVPHSGKKVARVTKKVRTKVAKRKKKS